MVKRSDNQQLIAVKDFPRRLVVAKAYWTSQKGVERSWAWIAHQTGHSRPVIAQVKTGKRPPTVEEGVIFATLFGVRAEWLLLDSGPMTEPAAERQPQIRYEQPSDSLPLTRETARAADEKAAEQRGDKPRSRKSR